MIVYGDPSFCESIATFRSRIASKLGNLHSAVTLDDLREVLVQAGQLEQGIADDAPDLEPQASVLTQAFADSFVAVWMQLAPGPGLAEIRRALDQLAPSSLRVRIKIPEGFAYYTLFPEAYAQAALEWAQSRESQSVLVLGVRSIGTTLSAVVTATLRQLGVPSRRATLRPTGHPFDRISRLPVQPQDNEWVLIVDEGPGLSGSSMASVATALADAGHPTDRIAFMPGHSHPPGAQASPTVRQWWGRVPVVSISTSELRWDGRSLNEVLAKRTEAQLESPLVQVEDFGGGAWRSAVFDQPTDWPAAAPSFERTKIRITTEGGRALLWKFEGLAAQPGRSAAVEQARRAELGWALPVRDAHLGFIATQWVSGARPYRTQRGADLVARYLEDCAGQPLDREMAQASQTRMREMALINIRELLGPELGGRAEEIFEDLPPGEGRPAAPDGRLAPHEWILREGRMLKTDATGHAFDHTGMGPQPLDWDQAGLSIEWGIPLTVHPAYGIAYCAHRAGIHDFGDDRTARERYLQVLRLLLAT